MGKHTKKKLSPYLLYKGTFFHLKNSHFWFFLINFRFLGAGANLRGGGKYINGTGVKDFPFGISKYTY